MAARREPLRMPRPGFRAIGLVERPAGLKGELKARPLTDYPERFDPGSTVFIGQRARTVQRSRWHKDRVYFKIDGVAGREAAEELRNLLIEIPDGEIPEEGAWYIDQIEGIAVVSRDGRAIGHVSEVLQTGANDVYVVSRQDERDLLIPALRDVIVEVDAAAGRMVVDLPDGLEPRVGQSADGRGGGGGRSGDRAD